MVNIVSWAIAVWLLPLQYSNMFKRLYFAGTPASGQNLHSSESVPKQDSLSATETLESTAEASQAESVKELTTSPSMPSLGGTTGMYQLEIK